MTNEPKVEITAQFLRQVSFNSSEFPFWYDSIKNELFMVLRGKAEQGHNKVCLGLHLHASVNDGVDRIGIMHRKIREATPLQMECLCQRLLELGYSCEITREKRPDGNVSLTVSW
jgi:hypothetical protein